MVEELTEDHRLWAQEMDWTPDFDLSALHPGWWEWAAQVAAWLIALVVLAVSLGQLLV